MNVLYAIMLLFCFVLTRAVAQETKPTKVIRVTAPKTTYDCKPTADEQCPSPQDYATLKLYLDKYKAPQDEQDRINGVVMRLQQAAPEGYHFDGTKLVYVKNPKPAEKK